MGFHPTGQICACGEDSELRLEGCLMAANVLTAFGNFPESFRGHLLALLARRCLIGHSEFDPAIRERSAWNAGCKVGAKKALKPRQFWAVRFCLDPNRRVRDRALFDLVIDSKITWLRLCENHDRRYRLQSRYTSPRNRNSSKDEAPGTICCCPLIP